MLEIKHTKESITLRKSAPNYENIQEFRNAYSNFRYSYMLSPNDIKLLETIMYSDNRRAWNLYLAVFDDIDKMLVLRG